MLLHEYLTVAAQRLPQKVALVCKGTRTSYCELAHRVSDFAVVLMSQGCTRGDRVIIFMENGFEAVIAVFGVVMTGGCIVVVNPATQAERLAAIIDDSGSRLVITSREKIAVLTDAEHIAGKTIGRIVADDESAETGNGGSTIQRQDSAVVCAEAFTESDLAAIIYTSGSTGRPKGVAMLHRNIHAAVGSVAEYLGNNESDIVLNVLPLSSSYGLLQLLVTFHTGGTLVLERGFGYPFEVLSKITQERVTGFAGTPTIFALLLRLRDVKPADVASLRYVTNAAAALPASFVPRLRAMFPTTNLFLMHGLTECLRTMYLPPADVDVRPTSAGRSMKNIECWVGTSDVTPVPPGVVGELFVRGPSVMQGYWNNQQATDAALLPGRYPWERILRTADLFTMDKDGYFYFVARSDELIKSKGEKVSPIEVEDVLYSLEGVTECRVIGVPDDVLGQAIKAEIVQREGMAFTVQEVKTHCRSHLEDFKIPHIVCFVSELPKTAGGKIKRTVGA